MPKKDKPSNESRCPHEQDWYCKLLDKPCHPGMSGCILSGQSLIDALIAFETHEGVIPEEDED